VFAPALGPTRTAADFAAHIAQTVAADPDASWRFLADNRNTHQAAALVRLVAERCGRPDPLGVKGRAGVLQSPATRAAFLADPTHRIQFLSTPTHTSWRNQIELWFSILVRRVLKRGSFASTDALCARIRAFMTSCNQTATPFKWTYRGRPWCR
jgi:hypothetical protein